MNIPKNNPEQIDQFLTEIAKTYLDIETLETRKSDSLDFHDIDSFILAHKTLEETYNHARTVISKVLMPIYIRLQAETVEKFANIHRNNVKDHRL